MTYVGAERAIQPLLFPWKTMQDDDLRIVEFRDNLDVPTVVWSLHASVYAWIVVSQLDQKAIVQNPLQSQPAKLQSSWS